MKTLKDQALNYIIGNDLLTKDPTAFEKLPSDMYPGLLKELNQKKKNEQIYAFFNPQRNHALLELDQSTLLDVLTILTSKENGKDITLPEGLIEKFMTKSFLDSKTATELVALGKTHPEIAIHILNQPDQWLENKLGKYNKKNLSVAIDNCPSMIPKTSGAYYLEFAKMRKDVKSYVLKKHANKLSPTDLETLSDDSIPVIKPSIYN